MPTSSFHKEFVLNSSEESIDNFLKILSTPVKPIELTIPKITKEEKEAQEKRLFELLKI